MSEAADATDESERASSSESSKCCPVAFGAVVDWSSLSPTMSISDSLSDPESERSDSGSEQSDEPSDDEAGDEARCFGWRRRRLCWRGSVGGGDLAGNDGDDLFSSPRCSEFVVDKFKML